MREEAISVPRADRPPASPYCVGCCWALMAVLVLVVMNLVWMAAIAGSARDRLWGRRAVVQMSM